MTAIEIMFYNKYMFQCEYRLNKSIFLASNNFLQKSEVHFIKLAGTGNEPKLEYKIYFEPESRSKPKFKILQEQKPKFLFRLEFRNRNRNRTEFWSSAMYWVG